MLDMALEVVLLELGLDHSGEGLEGEPSASLDGGRDGEGVNVMTRPLCLSIVGVVKFA